MPEDALSLCQMDPISAHSPVSQKLCPLLIQESKVFLSVSLSKPYIHNHDGMIAAWPFPMKERIDVNANCTADLYIPLPTALWSPLICSGSVHAAHMDKQERVSGQNDRYVPAVSPPCPEFRLQAGSVLHDLRSG